MVLDESELSKALAQYGGTNFSLDCVVAGRSARVAMTSDQVLLAVENEGAHAASFARVQVSGNGRERDIAFDGLSIVVTFASEGDGDRLVRVLGVRKEMHQAPSALFTVSGSQTGATAGALRPESGLPMPGTAGHRIATAQSSYETWAAIAMWSSTLLLGVAVLDLVLCWVVALVSFGSGAPLVGLIWLLFSAVSAAIPLCLGSLTKAVLYRNVVVNP